MTQYTEKIYSGRSKSGDILRTAIASRTSSSQKLAQLPLADGRGVLHKQIIYYIIYYGTVGNCSVDINLVL